MTSSPAHWPLTLSLFAKTPTLGQVKTRLARDLGEAGALAAYETMWSAVLTMADAFPAAVHELALTPVADATCVPVALSRSWRVVAQKGDDLGQRMLARVRAGLREQSAVMLIGADCPSVDGAYLAAAAEALTDGAQVVLGPSEDGGYVLLGLREALAPLFVDMPWGSDGVAAETLMRARALVGDADIMTLPARYDIDTVKDWERWCVERPR